MNSTYTSLLASCLSLLAAIPLHAQSLLSTALDRAVEAGIKSRTYPAAAVVVGRSDTILYAKGYGTYAWTGDSRKPDPGYSLWDVASLSKLITASAVAVEVDRNRLDLEAPVSGVLKDFAGEVKDHVTVRMLLDHTSGLPAWAALGGREGTAAGARSRLFDVGLSRPVGETALYSDLNAILAGEVVSTVSGMSLDDFTRERVFIPTGMRNATWRPTPADQLRSVPSERQADGTYLVGTVHDPNARVLGGVAGHAGVFATGYDLAHFAQTWLRGLRNADSSWLHPATLARFATRSEIAGTRALGWDTPLLSPPDGMPPLYGACATPTTIGHTGFTGTLIWLDVEEDLFVVFLTNRSFQPTRRSNSEMRELRAAVSDAARRLAGVSCR